MANVTKISSEEIKGIVNDAMALKTCEPTDYAGYYSVAEKDEIDILLAVSKILDDDGNDAFWVHVIYSDYTDADICERTPEALTTLITNIVSRV